MARRPKIRKEVEVKSVLLIGAVLYAALAPVQAPAQQAAATAIKPPAVQAPGYYRVTLGDYKITVLPDGTTPDPFGDLIHGAPGKVWRMHSAKPASRLIERRRSTAS